MILKNKFIDIIDSDIFENDKLDRKDAIENLSHLIVSTKEAFTLSINADWGAGKTTFIKLWQTHLKKEHQVNSIYFSAWEDDFSKEPLISILGEIKKYLDDNFSSDSTEVKSFEKVKNFGGKVLKRGVPAFLKGITGGVVDFDKGFEEAIGAIVESTAKELIDNYSKDKQVTQEFKESIKDLLSKIDDSKPFVVFIDELDRCRPTYAIELLERVKHIFGIDGLIFVLSIDKKQLSESIKSQYGNIDTNAYLKRFIDLEYNLINDNLDKFCEYLYYSVYELDKVLTFKQIKQEYREYNELEILKYLVKSMNLTLREIEQVFIQINIIFKTIPPRFFEMHFRIIVLFIVLKLKNLQLYEDLINHKKSTEELLTYILKVADKGDTYSRRFYQYFEVLIEAIVLATAKDDDQMNLVIQDQRERLQDCSDEEEKKKIERLAKILAHGENHGMYRLNMAIDTVIQKISFIDKFNF